MQELNEQGAHLFRLFLLHPMSGAAHQVTAEYARAGGLLHALEIAGALVGAPGASKSRSRLMQPVMWSFYPLARVRSILPDVQNGARLYDPTAGNGMPSAHDAGAVLYNGLWVVEDRGGTPGSL